MAIMLARSWWVLMLRGLCALLLGVATLVRPGMTLIALIVVFGAYAFLDGLLAVVGAVRAADNQQRPAGPLLLEGLIGIAAGVMTFVWPGLIAGALVYLIAAWAILTGVMEIVIAVGPRRASGGGWLLVLGLLSVVFGLYVAFAPVAGALAMLWLIGAYGLCFGALLLALGFRLRSWQQHPL